MKDSIRRGLEEEGVLPGPLNLRRKASTYFIRATGYKESLRSRGLIFSYALGSKRRECFGWKDCYGTNLWIMWGSSGRTVSFTQES